MRHSNIFVNVAVARLFVTHNRFQSCTGYTFFLHIYMVILRSSLRFSGRKW